MSLIRSFLVLIIALKGAIAHAGDVVVTQFGAVGDGKTINTEAIQKAIDACSSQGGGKVFFPEGVWTSGTILLKDGVTIDLHEKAVLSGSTDINHYQLVDGFKDGRGSSMGYCFIGAKDVRHVGITGKGRINGNGKLLLEKNGRSKRPFLVRFVRAEYVTVSDVYMEGPAAWTMHFYECKNVLAERVVIRSRGLSNNDGIDIDCCAHVVIRDCDIDSGDDAVCLKATGPQPCRDIEVSGCTINTGQGAFKLGTESMGNFEDINIHDCTVKETKGIKLYSVDGSHLKNLNISNITIEKTTLPILLRLGSRLKTFREGDRQKPVGIIDGVTISNIQVKQASQMAMIISGIPGHLIQNVSLSDISVHLPGGGSEEDAKVQLPEVEGDYPEVTMFGKVMPAYGLYIRHAHGIAIKNVRISLAKPDARPAIIGIDVGEVKLENIKMPATASDEPYVRLEAANDITLSKVSSGQKPAVFLEVAGATSKNIVLHADRPHVKLADGVAKSAVRIKNK